MTLEFAIVSWSKLATSFHRIMSVAHKTQLYKNAQHYPFGNGPGVRPRSESMMGLKVLPSTCESTLGAQIARIASLIMRELCAGLKLERHIVLHLEGWPTPPATACF
jgi:hypothetical protein